MKRLSGLVILLGMLCLTACGQVYKTEYHYIPPKSDNGRLCVVQCKESKAYCQQACRVRKEQCRSLARKEATRQYEMYVKQQQLQGKHLDKTENDFEYTSQCNQSCGCDDMFNRCYQTCGGVIEEKQSV